MTYRFRVSSPAKLESWWCSSLEEVYETALNERVRLSIFTDTATDWKFQGKLNVNPKPPLDDWIGFLKDEIGWMMIEKIEKGPTPSRWTWLRGGS